MSRGISHPRYAVSTPCANGPGLQSGRLPSATRRAGFNRGAALAERSMIPLPPRIARAIGRHPLVPLATGEPTGWPPRPWDDPASLPLAAWSRDSLDPDAFRERRRLHLSQSRSGHEAEGLLRGEPAPAADLVLGRPVFDGRQPSTLPAPRRWPAETRLGAGGFAASAARSSPTVPRRALPRPRAPGSATRPTSAAGRTSWPRSWKYLRAGCPRRSEPGSVRWQPPE